MRFTTVEEHFLILLEGDSYSVALTGVLDDAMYKSSLGKLPVLTSVHSRIGNKNVFCWQYICLAARKPYPKFHPKKSNCTHQ